MSLSCHLCIAKNEEEIEKIDAQACIKMHIWWQNARIQGTAQGDIMHEAKVAGSVTLMTGQWMKTQLSVSRGICEHVRNLS